MLKNHQIWGNPAFNPFKKAKVPDSIKGVSKCTSSPPPDTCNTCYAGSKMGETTDAPLTQEFQFGTKMEHIEKSWLSPDKGIEKTRTGRNNRKINIPSRFSNGSLHFTSGKLRINPACSTTCINFCCTMTGSNPFGTAGAAEAAPAVPPASGAANIWSGISCWTCFWTPRCYALLTYKIQWESVCRGIRKWPSIKKWGHMNQWISKHARGRKSHPYTSFHVMVD